MDAMTALMTRRSVRKFRPDQIPEPILMQIIRAGTYAPSALALQPWAFVIVQDKAFLDRVSAYCLPRMIAAMKDSHGGMSEKFREMLESPGYQLYYHAPTIIMLVGKTKSRFREIDVSLCAENMMLAAHALGLGSCWIGSTEVSYDNPELVSGWKIPEGYSPVGTIAFGYPDETPELHAKNEPLIVRV